jgi:uncharacterized protein (DUF302 family)
MKSKISIPIYIIFGFIAGIVFSGVVISISAGEMLVKEIKSPYDFDKTVKLMSDRINKKDGWHVTDIIDQDQEVSRHGGYSIGNYKIIKYCSGSFSADMLSADDRKLVGNMMPKSFAVYEKSDGQVYVSIMNGAVMGKLFGGEIETIIEKVSLEVEDMMRFMNFKYTLF